VAAVGVVHLERLCDLHRTVAATAQAARSGRDGVDLV
jgi:hypothetical protein